MDYWNRKEELKKHAREWYDKMQTEHADEIAYSVENTIEYAGRPNTPGWRDIYDTKFVLMKTDIVSALFQCKEMMGHFAVHNFSSFKEASGKFFDGSSAEEESICGSSTLANVITDEKFADWYAWNRQHLNYGLYLDRALYSPNILFMKGQGETMADVITCAAPNWKVCRKYHPEKEGDNFLALDDRTMFLKAICKAQNVDTFITGAWG